MNAIEKILNKFKKLERSFDDILEDTLNRNKDEVEELQTEQMRLGQDSNGLFIGELRNPAYARNKKARGGIAPFGKVDLRNTGAFQRGIKAKVSQNAIFLDSSDSKRGDLTDKYEETIFGLNQESIKKMKERFLIRDLQFEIKRYIQSA